MRAPTACDGCRARKIKCDSENLPEGQACSKCVSAEIDCTYTYKRRKRKPISKPPNTLDSAKELIEEVLTSEYYIPPSNSTTVRDIIISIAKYARSIEESLARSRAAIMRMGGDPPPTQPGSSQRESASPPSDAYSSEESDDEQVNGKVFKQISMGQSDARHWGKSSNFRFMYSAMKLPEGRILNLARRKRPEYWELDIWKLPQPLTPPPLPYRYPEPDLLWHLTSIYFTQTAPYLPLIHAPTFKRAVINGLHLVDYNFGAVVLAVCAIGARGSEDPRVLHYDTRLTSGWQWFRQIRLLRPNLIETTSVHELQLYCLAYVYLQHTNMWDSTWALIGLGIRLAIDRGVHRLKPSSTSTRTAENELFIRAFWILRSFDIVQGLTLGRPPATTSEEFDLDKPAECDDEYWEKTGSCEPFKQPVGKVSLLSFFTYYLKLMEIAASVQKSIYAVKTLDSRDGVSPAERNRQKVMEQDSALNDWLAALPPHLRWEPHQPNEIFLNQSAILLSTYHWVQIQVQKNFIIRPATRSPQSFPSLAICALAARSIVRMAQVLRHRSSDQQAAVVVGRVMLHVAHSGTILALILWRNLQGIDPGPTTDVKTIASDVSLSLDLLATAETTSQVYGRIRDKLTTFVEAEGVLSNVSNLPPLTGKRMREDGVDGSLPSSSEHSEPNVNLAEIARPLAGSQRAASSIPTVDNFGHFPSNSFVNVPSSNFESSASIWTDGGLFGIADANLLTPAAFDEAFGKGSQTASAYQISENDVLPSGTIQTELTDWDTFMKDIDDALVSMWA